MTGRCAICGKPKADDLFSAVTNDLVCSICKIKFIGGLPTTQERVGVARERLGLVKGEYLVQDNAAEATKILGRGVAPKLFWHTRKYTVAVAED